MADDLASVWRAPVAWAKDAGVDGSQCPLWMLFVCVVGVVAGIAQVVREPSLANVAFAAASLVGAVAIDVWLIRWYRQRTIEH